MISRHTFEFLRDLEKNNSKEWVDKNRERYNATKEDVINFAQNLIDAFSDTYPEIATLDPKKCLTRLNRDMRFAKDKPPYKWDFYLVLNKKSLHGTSAGFYVHIEPGNNFLGGGAWNPLPDELKKFRREISDSFDEWNKMVGTETFKKQFPNGIQGVETLVRIPKGFNEDDPAAELLKMKGFTTKESITNKDLMSKDAVNIVVEYFTKSKPLVDFLNRSLD